MPAHVDTDKRPEPVRFELNTIHQLSDVPIGEIAYGGSTPPASVMAPGGLAPVIIGGIPTAPAGVAPVVTMRGAPV